MPYINKDGKPILWEETDYWNQYRKALIYYPVKAKRKTGCDFTYEVIIDPSPTPTNTPTNTPTQTPTNTPTNTPTQTPSNTPTQTPTPTLTPTNTPTPSPVETYYIITNDNDELITNTGDNLVWFPM